MKKTIITSYYVILFAILVVKASTTVHHLSQQVDFGVQFQQLTRHESLLEAELIALENKKTEQLSLSTLESFAEKNDFVAITNPWSISNSSLLAQSR